MVLRSSFTVAGTFMLSAFVFCQVFYPSISLGMAFAKRPPGNLYMPPFARLPGSKPFTPLCKILALVLLPHVVAHLEYIIKPYMSKAASAKIFLGGKT